MVSHSLTVVKLGHISAILSVRSGRLAKSTFVIDYTRS